MRTHAMGGEARSVDGEPIPDRKRREEQLAAGQWNPYSGALAQFGEKAQYRKKDDAAKLETKWPEMISIGQTLLDDSRIALTPEGAEHCEDVRSQKWGRELVVKVKGTPWNLLGTSKRESLKAGGEALRKPASRARLCLKD